MADFPNAFQFWCPKTQRNQVKFSKVQKYCRPHHKCCWRKVCISLHCCISRTWHITGIQRRADERALKWGRNTCQPICPRFPPRCGSGCEHYTSPKGQLLCSRELYPQKVQANSSIPITPRPRLWRGNSTVLVSQHRPAPPGTVPGLWASPSLGPARAQMKLPGTGRRGAAAPRRGGPDVTHLGKGLAAAETVNLHFIEAGDLHRGAEEQPPPFPSRTLQCTQAP